MGWSKHPLALRVQLIAGASLSSSLDDFAAVHSAPWFPSDESWCLLWLEVTVSPLMYTKMFRGDVALVSLALSLAVPLPLVERPFTEIVGPGRLLQRTFQSSLRCVVLALAWGSAQFTSCS